MINKFQYLMVRNGGSSSEDNYWTAIAPGKLIFARNVAVDFNDKFTFDDNEFQVKGITREGNLTMCDVCPDPTIYLMGTA